MLFTHLEICCDDCCTASFKAPHAGVTASVARRAAAAVGWEFVIKRVRGARSEQFDICPECSAKRKELARANPSPKR